MRPLSFMYMSLLALWLGCGPQLIEGSGGAPSAPEPPPVAQPPSPPPPAPCSAGATRCQGGAFQTCQGGFFRDAARCTADETCDPDLACIGASSCGVGSDLIYLLDPDANLYGFNPRRDVHLVKLIRRLRCDTQLLSDVNSMAIDRKGNAWVSGRDGWIVKIDVRTGACTAPPFPVSPRAQGFRWFGMGFVSTTAGSDREQLFLAGPANHNTDGPLVLGRVDPLDLSVARVAGLPMLEQPPELTGTGAGELYGYSPGRTLSQILQLDKASGAVLRSFPLPPIAQAGGWAFAHWGGRFYVFVTDTSSQVQRFDPRGAQHTRVRDLPFRVLGAGVSTCAPIILG